MGTLHHPWFIFRRRLNAGLGEIAPKLFGKISPSRRRCRPDPGASRVGGKKGAPLASAREPDPKGYHAGIPVTVHYRNVRSPNVVSPREWRACSPQPKAIRFRDVAKAAHRARLSRG